MFFFHSHNTRASITFSQAQSTLDTWKLWIFFDSVQKIYMMSGSQHSLLRGATPNFTTLLSQPPDPQLKNFKK